MGPLNLGSLWENVSVFALRTQVAFVVSGFALDQTTPRGLSQTESLEATYLERIVCEKLEGSIANEVSDHRCGEAKIALIVFEGERAIGRVGV